MARTRRSPDGLHARPGAVNQHGGKLPIYLCNTCDSDVVWCESKRTGRKYLANIYRGQGGARFYMGNQPHKCEEVLKQRAERAARLPN